MTTKEKLFSHLHIEHGLILVSGELDEIINIILNDES